MKVAIHSQGVACTDALCLHIAAQLQQAVGRAAACDARATLDLDAVKQPSHEARVHCRMTMTLVPSTTITLTVSAPTPGAAIDQAAAFLKQVVTSPVHSEPAPAVRLPVVTRIPASTLFRRCERGLQ